MEKGKRSKRYNCKLNSRKDEARKMSPQDGLLREWWRKRQRVDVPLADRGGG